MRGRGRPDDGHRGVGQCFRELPVQRGTAGEVRRQARLEGSFRQHQHFLERPDVGEVQEKNRLDGPVPLLQEENVSAELLEKFKDYWNWEELSDNNCLTPELIDQFADFINWKALINNWSCCEKLATEEFIRKYSDRIPACDFKDSRLWREMVERKEKQIKKRICLC